MPLTSIEGVINPSILAFCSSEWKFLRFFVEHKQYQADILRRARPNKKTKDGHIGRGKERL